MNLSDEDFAAWTAALRSGEYVQTNNNLYRSDGAFCCMGVAGKVCLKLPLSLMLGAGYMRFMSRFRETAEDKRPFTVNEEAILGWLNDEARLTFTQIAAFVEGDGLHVFNWNYPSRWPHP